MTSVASAIPTKASTSGAGDKARLYLIAFVLVLPAELIGNITIPVGPVKIVLLPLLWALLMGAAIALPSQRLPPGIGVGTQLQRAASAILQPAQLLFIAKLVRRRSSARWSDLIRLGAASDILVTA